MVNKPTGVPLSDFQSIARPSDIKEDAPKRPHPDNPSILSPLDATEFLKANPHIAAAGVKTSEERRAWLEHPEHRNNSPYFLNWSGPLDSNYDWVAFGFMVGNQWYVASGALDGGWQWATRSHPYDSGWTPQNVESRGGFGGNAYYFIWDPGKGKYVTSFG
jgi:hypothetical protein